MTSRTTDDSIVSFNEQEAQDMSVLLNEGRWPDLPGRMYSLHTALLAKIQRALLGIGTTVKVKKEEKKK